MKSFVAITAFVFLGFSWPAITWSKYHRKLFSKCPATVFLTVQLNPRPTPERPFYAFGSVYYAEMPTPENRFLVSALCIIMYEQQPWLKIYISLHILIACGSKIFLPAR